MGVRGIWSLVWLGIATLAPLARAEIGDLLADVALGSSSPADVGTVPLGPSSFAIPKGVAVDRSVIPNRVYVSDSVYHRVLGWSDADSLANGAPADLVIGQPDFTSYGCNRNTYFSGVPAGATTASLCQPAGLAVDGAGNLFVADSGNCRVLVFQDPFGTDGVADAILGQTSGVCTGATAADRLYDPMGVAVDSAGNAFVADTLHCRVLEYDTPLVSDHLPDRVYGQPDFTSSGCSNPNRLYFPQTVAVDASQRLWVGSPAVVYGYDAAIASDQVIDHQIGTSQCNANGENASSSCGPIAVATDGARLYVGDAGNSRVLEFDTPSTVAQAARVFGQPSFSGTADLFHDACNLGGASAGSLCLRRVELLTLGGTYTEAAAVAVDSSGRLYVADGLNHRVLRYDAPLTTDRIADVTLGHAGMTDVRRPAVPIEAPAGVAVGSGYTVAVVDAANSRLLFYPSLGSWNDAPVAVLGQPDLATVGCNSGGLGAASLCNPTTAFVDRNGNLWVADTGNNRVLEYPAPWFETDTVNQQFVVHGTAARVFGQPDFTTAACGAGASGLCGPRAVALDSHDELYVADTQNNRIVHHQNPLADTAAERVLGQSTFAAVGCNAGGRSAASLCGPRGLAFDADGNLYVADAGNHRVLQYAAIGVSDTVADRVFGQGGVMTTGAPSAGTGGLSAPSAVAFDPGGNLYVADEGNNRLLEFDAPAAGDDQADRVFGQASFAATGCRSGADGLCAPDAIAFAYTNAGDALFVGDAGNHRVVRYDAPFCRGDFSLTAANRTLHSQRSKPLSTTIKAKLGPSLDDDELDFKDKLVLLEPDGGIEADIPPLLTLSNAGGVVWSERVPDLSNRRVTANGGVWNTPYLKGERDHGVDDFTIKTRFVIPGNPLQSQYDKIDFAGRGVGLALGGLTSGSATFRAQFGSLCFTTELGCRSNGVAVSCRPAR